MELNDKNGSTPEAISEFVRREYEDLPWAHSKILSLHLGRLCEVGEIVCTENGRYMFPVGGMEKKEKEKEKEPCKGSRKRRRGCRSKLALLDSDTTEEASTQVAESDDHLIGSVEEKAKLQSEKVIQLQVFGCFGNLWHLMFCLGLTLSGSFEYLVMTSIVDSRIRRVCSTLLGYLADKTTQ